MSRTTSTYTTSPEVCDSDDDPIDFSGQNTNNSNNPYRGSFFFEESTDSIIPTTAIYPNSNGINRSSAHSFTVFIDDSKYHFLRSLSNSSDNISHNAMNNNLEALGNTDDHIPTEDDTNPTDPSTHNTSSNIPQSSSRDDSCPSISSKSTNNRLMEILTPEEISPVIHQSHTNQHMLRRDHTSESMGTDDTEYFEADDFLSSDNHEHTEDIPLLKTSINNNDGYDNIANSDKDSADSIDTQDTEILDTGIRNSQSFIQNVRDSVKTVSTMILTQDPDSSVITDSKAKNDLDSLNKGLGITMPEPDSSSSPMRKLSVRDRLFSASDETPSKDVSFASVSTNNASNKNRNLTNNTNHHTGDANSSVITESSFSSLFQHDEFDETIEPDIEQAVQLLKREIKSRVPTVNYIGSSNQRNNIYSEQNRQRDNEDESTDKDKSSSKSGNSTNSEGNFVPHELIIPNKLTLSNPPTPIIARSESHIPRSPSLINKFLVTPSPEKKSSFSSGKRHERNISFVNHAKISPLYGRVSLDTNVSSPTGSLQRSVIPKVHVLQSVSGPNKWKPNPTTKAQMVSLLGSNEFRSPIKKLSFHEDMLLDHNKKDTDSKPTELVSVPNNNIPKLEPIIDDDIEQDIPIALKTTTASEHVHTKKNPTLTPPLPAGVSTFRFNTTGVSGDEASIPKDVSPFIKRPIYIQHIDSPSIHSFDSQSYKFWDIYSLKRVILLILVCLIIPPLFFMIYAGSVCGIDDKKLMKIVLNNEHRIGLFRGFIWDIDLNWLRTMSLIIGIAEIVIIIACVGIGFGVGLTR